MSDGVTWVKQGALDFTLRLYPGLHGMYSVLADVGGGSYRDRIFRRQHDRRCFPRIRGYQRVAKLMPQSMRIQAYVRE